MFEGGKERYQRLETNGEKAEVGPDRQTRAFPRAMNSARYCAACSIRMWLRPTIGRADPWPWALLCQVFEFEVSRAKSNFVLHYGATVAAAAYNGRVFIDEDTGMVRRLTIQGSGLPKDFGLQSPALSLDYGMVKIGEKDYLLPLRSVLQLRQAKVFVRNETVFRGYRKFQAESEIKFGK